MRKRPRSSGSAPASDLDQVLDAERRLAALVAEAEADAAETVAGARRRAGELEEAAPRSLELVMRQLQDAESAYRATEFQAIAGWATRERARFSELSESARQRLVDLAMDRLAEGGP